MAITLGANIPSYSARMQLNKVTDGLSSVFQRLSTGEKINSAGDDAAGLVISQNMQAKIDGSKQAMQNIQTAKSFLTIAEDGMVSVGDQFRRINDLLTNMANDTNDVDSRLAAVREVIERLSEINRIAESINFNGMKMLDGSSKSIIVQMGPDSDSDTSTIDISEALTDCHVSAFNAEIPDLLNPNAYYLTANEDTIVTKDSYVNAEKYWFVTEDDTVKIITKDEEGNYVYAKKVDDEYVKYTGEVSKLEAAKSGYTIKNKAGDVSAIYLSDGAATPKYYTIGTDADATATVTGTYSDDKLTSYFGPTNAICRAYMATVQTAISEISTRRGLLGAYENRMESSYDAMTTRVESLETAKVPYTDTDIAQTATEMMQSQILQQINVSVLQNANVTQQLALSLLGKVLVYILLFSEL